jgi:predicted amidohydrolase YtcJ
VSAAGSSAAGGGDQTGGPAELVVRNGRIFTGDQGLVLVSALAVRDGRVVAVGGDAEMAGYVGPGTQRVDALGRRVIPGLNDSHLHVIRGGLNYFLELRWDGVRSLRDGLSMLADQARRTPPGQWVRVVGGWSSEQFAERRLPSVPELNAAAPDTPVFVLHLYQAAVLNRAAVDAVGLTRDSPDPPGGTIVRGRDGRPTGLLLAAPAAGILYATLAKGPTLDPEDQQRSTRWFLQELNRFGLTSAVDAAGGFQSFPENYQTVMALAERGELSVRIGYHLFPQTAGQELDDLRRFVTTVKPGEGDEWLRCNGAGENLTWAAADYENFAQPRPEVVAGAAGELEAAVRLVRDHGWGFRLHATYDETIDRDLTVFEKVAGGAREGLGVPWFFDHAETVSERNLDRIAALGGAVSVQDRMLFQGGWFVDRYGAARAAAAPPIGSMLERGLTVAAGTDATRVASYNPWLSLAWLVGCPDFAGRRLRDRRHVVDRETALRMYTVAGAALTGEADVKGTLRPGCFGDLAILTDDYFTVPDEEIAGIESVLTVVGGRVVYAAGEYAGLDDPLPDVSPPWSPVGRFGGFHSSPLRRGYLEAQALLEVAGGAADQRDWRVARGDLDPTPPSAFVDPCLDP